MTRGRKAAATLWRPDRVGAIGPIYVGQFQADTPLAAVLQFIGELPDPEFYDSKALTVSDVQLRFAIADVIRRRWYPKMRIEVNGKVPKASTSALCRAEGLVLSKLLSLINEVFTVNPCGYEHPAYWWLDCCLEASAHRPLYLAEAGASTTQSAVREQYTGHTATLRRFDNPFQGNASKLLFNVATGLAANSVERQRNADSDLFHGSRYVPYLEARAAIASLSRKKGFKLVKEISE